MLLNYTSRVAPGRTILELQRTLADAGAHEVSARYAGGSPVGLAFVIDTPAGRRSFTLPVNADKVYAVMVADRVEKRYRNREQAERTAWRIVKDWVEAQLAIVATEMVTLDQVMLPYMTLDSAGRTVYELFVDRTLALGSGE